MLRIVRKWNRPDYCIGKLYLDNNYVCDTLEDTDRGLHQQMSEAEIKAKKVYGKTAIPVGTYKVDMTTVSPKFKSRSWAQKNGGRVPRILNVKGFEGVLIHPGNTAEDTLGCVLLGENKVKGKVTNSQTQWLRFIKAVGIQPQQLQITREFSV